MPDQTFSLDVIQIKSPCSASWEAMEGDDVQRFCDDCQLHVHNLSQMRRRDAEALVSGVRLPEGPRVCVQMQRGPDGRVVTLDDRRAAGRLHRRAAYIGVRTLVGLGTAAVVLLGSTGVLASRETQLVQKMQQWKTSWFPQSYAVPLMGAAPVVHPPIPGQAHVPPPGPDEIRLGEMELIRGDIMVPEPVPPVIKGRLVAPSTEGKPGAEPLSPNAV